MLISELYTNLQLFVIAATGYLDKQVVFANQSSSRPIKPFITIQLKNFKNIGTPFLKTVDSTGLQTTQIWSKCIAEFNAYSDSLHEAETILDRLHFSFDTDMQNDMFVGAMAKLRTVKDVTALPMPLNAQIESRAILEVEIGYNKIITYITNFIEKVETEYKITGI